MIKTIIDVCSGSFVSSVNQKTGDVVLTAADVGAATAAQGALAETALQTSSFATVATTGSYADLLNKPTIPATAADIGAATAAQGAKADTAVQPAALQPVATTGSYNDLIDKPVIPSTAADIGAAAIDDTAASTTAVWSSQKTSDQITGAVNGLVSGAPAAMDTLKEFADALGDDANFAATTATALGNRLRVDAAQGLTGTQQTQGRSNLGVYGTTDIGDPTTDFVAVLNAGLV